MKNCSVLVANYASKTVTKHDFLPSNPTIYENIYIFPENIRDFVECEDWIYVIVITKIYKLFK